jgi:cell division protein FtsN
VTLIVSVLILAVVVGGVLWLYRGGVKGGDGSPPTISAPAGADRTAAPVQATPPDASAGLSIYKDNGAPASGAPTFAPPPEQPGARPTAPAPNSAPAVAPVAPPVAARAKSGDEIGDLIDKPVAPPAKAAKPLPVAKPVAEKPAKPPIAKSAVAATDSTPASGAAEVQIGAFSTRAQADQGWGAAAAAAPGAMAGRGKKVEEISKDGKTLYRTSITGFSSRESAQALCARLQAAGRSCFVR